MKYIIIHSEGAFITNWYDYENNYVEGMIIVRLSDFTISFDGENFKEIEQDHL